jgi:hypothetical protein
VSPGAESGSEVATVPEIATGFAKASRDSRVTAPEQAPAVTVCAAVT